MRSADEGLVQRCQARRSGTWRSADGRKAGVGQRRLQPMKDLSIFSLKIFLLALALAAQALHIHE